MKKKTRFHLLITMLVVTFSIVGCVAASSGDVEAESDQYFYDESTGKIHTDLSDNFDLKVEQWKYYYDAEAEQDRILLSIVIKNKTDRKIEDFNAVVCLNQNAADLVASGTLVYDQFEPCDLVPQKTANGASYAIDFLVEHDAWLQEIHADKRNLLDEIRSVTLDLSWRGGNETIALICDQLDDADDSDRSSSEQQ